MKPSLAALVAVLMLSATPQAEDKGREEKLPPSGVLSRSVSGGYQSKQVALPWGASKSGIVEDAPISGSVSRRSEREWMMRVFNNSNDTYSASVRVVQRGESGTITKSDYFSYTLKPKGSAERVVSGAPGTVDAQLVLDNWRNLSATPIPPTPTPTKAPPPTPRRKPAS